jgi:hypothetical protein
VGIYPTDVEQEEVVWGFDGITNGIFHPLWIDTWNLSSSVEGDYMIYIGYLHVIGHTDMLTDTAVTVDV